MEKSSVLQYATEIFVDTGEFLSPIVDCEEAKDVGADAVTKSRAVLTEPSLENDEN